MDASVRSSSPRLKALALLAFCFAALVIAVGVAPLIGGSAAWPTIRDLRLPRVVFAAIAGFGLAACGVVLQAVLKNPLASPYTLGIASGAAVGAVIAIQLGLAAAWVTGGALGGALATSVLVYGVAALRQHAAETLLLTGVAITLFASAVTTLLHYLALGGSTIDLVAMVRWSMASLEVVGFGPPAWCGALSALGLLCLLPVVRQLDVASLDDASALGLGVDPIRVRRLAFLGTSLITAAVVAFAGPIGFVGLVVPHALRPFTGPDPRLLLPCSALLGGAFLVMADALARQVIYPTTLPINVVTYAVGCPAFIWILVRRGK
ncbi:MAG: iron ABC transporter permease [Planctomycetes bacterium]|nr:iron ABC transporter permease [Planctomycetota bacterium]